METVNEELRIYKCHVGELTGKEAGKFLEKFPGTPLSKMTVFYDRDKDIILINRDSVCSDAAIETIMLYLTGKGEEVEKYIHNHNSMNWLIEIAGVANDVRDIRAVKEDSQTGEELCQNRDVCLTVGELEEVYKEQEPFKICLKTFYIAFARGYKAGQRNT